MHELISIYAKLGFLNVPPVLTQLLLSMLTVSIFLLNYFSQNYMKLVLWSTMLSIGLDLIWIIGWSSNYWSIKTGSDIASENGFYLKYIVFSTILNIILKV